MKTNKPRLFKTYVIAHSDFMATGEVLAERASLIKARQKYKRLEKAIAEQTAVDMPVDDIFIYRIEQVV